MADWKTGAKHSPRTVTIQKVYASVSRVLAGESRIHCPHASAPYEGVPHMPLPLSGLWHQGPKTSLPFCPLGHLFGGRMGGVSVRPIPRTSPCPCSHIRGSCDTPSCPTSHAHSVCSVSKVSESGLSLGLQGTMAMLPLSCAVAEPSPQGSLTQSVQLLCCAGPSR